MYRAVLLCSFEERRRIILGPFRSPKIARSSGKINISVTGFFFFLLLFFFFLLVQTTQRPQPRFFFKPLIGHSRLSEEATATLRGAWESSSRALASAGVKGSIMANQLVDMEWKFGVTAASDELGQVGSTFLHMKLVVDKGNGLREDVFMELTLPQFYEFMADMEKAKTYVDFLAS